MTFRDLYSAPVVFLLQLRGTWLPEPVREFEFSTDRLWRFDFAWPDRKIAIEIEGGISDRRRGRHIRAIGYQEDLDKYNAAAAAGWRVFRFSTRDVQTRCAIDLLAVVFAASKRAQEITL